jgi:large subunit ribosomal protein L30
MTPPASKKRPAAGKEASAGRVRVTLVRGWAGKSERQQRTLRGLGLRRRGDHNDLPNTPAVAGAIAKVSHLVSVETA